MEGLINMETTDQSSLFELTLDQESFVHLNETARWGKFLAIAGFVMCGVIVVLAFVVGSILASTALWQPAAGRGLSTTAFAPIGGALIGGVYLVFAGVYFFPCLFLLRFSVRMKAALKAHDQVLLNSSLRAQRNLFRYVGIMMIVGLGILAIEALAIAVVALVGIGTK